MIIHGDATWKGLSKGPLWSNKICLIRSRVRELEVTRRNQRLYWNEFNPVDFWKLASSFLNSEVVLLKLWKLLVANLELNLYLRFIQTGNAISLLDGTYVYLMLSVGLSFGSIHGDLWDQILMEVRKA